ncbi:beta-lactamase family protein [Paenibacillus sp. MWE-103]|uniref:Beta-lactamase family protein n=1 Tax=Paenibacillus artemisiicola TaxID=1172618 RepID=A0ABS3WD93_9BACL|nr:serine hydrolase domain-containing protein [Paenibacillus artemisiicola]MBO7746288.1 beta-lactamase family protein [Paenibacillus artemisiicola]
MTLTQTIRAYVDEYAARWPFSGAVLAAQGGEIVFEAAYGMACLEFAVPNRTDTRFGLASVSKQLAAFAAMRLHDEGRIDIDRPVNDGLPAELRVDPRITAHQLMTHTSGLRTFHHLQEDFFGEREKLPYDRELLLGYFRQRPLNFEPGTRFEYCNAGYHLLAFLIEAASGRPYKRYLAEAVFGPLGMADTEVDDGSALLARRAFGYGMNGERIVPAEYHHPGYSIGAGGIVSTCGDLHAWHRALKERRLLGSAAYERLFAPNLNGCAGGLFSDEFRGRPRWRHDGAHLGIGAYVQHFFADDACVIVLANYDFANVTRVGDAVAELMFGGRPAVPGKPPAVEPDEALARRYEGVYVPGRAELKRTEEGWSFVHLGRIEKPLYPVGGHRFHSTWLDHAYTLREGEDGEFEFLGVRRPRGEGAPTS